MSVYGSVTDHWHVPVRVYGHNSSKDFINYGFFVLSVPDRDSLLIELEKYSHGRRSI